MKILICDDEYATRLITKAYLEMHPVETIEASNGEEALALIEREEPDVMIIDYTMPGITGLDVIKKLSGRAVPVIVVATAEGFTEATEKELRKYAAEYLVKPVTEKKLIETIEKATGVNIKNG